MERLGRYWNRPPAWRSTMPLPEEAAQIAAMAQRLLDDPVLHEALARMERKLVEAWRATAAGDTEQREAAYRMLWAAEAFKSELRLMVANARATERRQAG
jgi:SRSO17 transposase